MVRELLERMKHDDFDKARAEARRLADLSALEEIQAILESTKDQAEKLYCYWILGGSSGRVPPLFD